MTDAQSTAYNAAILAGKTPAEAYAIVFPTKKRLDVNGNTNTTGSGAWVSFDKGTTYVKTGETQISTVFGSPNANSAYMALRPTKTAANFAFNNHNYHIIINNDTAYSLPNQTIFRRHYTAPVEEFAGGGTGAVTFNGTNQYFTAPNAQVVNWLPGTGAFTIEFFIKKGVGGASAPRVFSLGFDTTATIGVSIESGTCYVWPYGGDLSGAMPAGYEAGTNWAHVAICRSGTTTKLYIDGVLKATKTGDSRDIKDAINPGFDLQVGVDNPLAGSPNWWSGKLTNFRWDNSAIYTGASLTVPTAPLTKSATTKLLMLGGGSTNPVYDAAGINTLVNNGAVWNAETPFV